MHGFSHKEVEKRAQEKWAKSGVFETDLKDESKDPYYLLFEFPYPSGDLHIGHWYAFALTDIYARYKRMEGKNVLFPVGFDAFGLPAENAAIKHGVNPREWTYKNMERMREQIKSMGTSVDWTKEVITCDPEYYKWTQWLFLKLFQHGLAERREAPVKWCPKDKTVLANEQVIDGHCERCGSDVEEKRLTQWFLRITDYAERLLSDLDPLPWREDIKEAQRAWIGKSEGAKLHFPIEGFEEKIEVFTTRPDTVYGATYVVLAPEHAYVDALLSLTTNRAHVEAYRKETGKRTERERSESKEKTGICLEGVVAINPATKEQIPIYIADYVLASYGTGAVMAVPAHDERDYEFARRHGLPIRPVVAVPIVNEQNPALPGKKEVERNVIHAVLRNPKNNTYLLAYLKDDSWGDKKPVNFVIGGVNDDEDWKDAAIREIREETGHTDIRFVEELPFEVEARFYQKQKDVNRLAHIRTFVFDLVSDTKEEVSKEEKAKHDFQWVEAEKVGAELNVPTDQLIWTYLSEGGEAYTGTGPLVNSWTFTGRANEDAMWEIVDAVGGERAVNYRLRDWLVSRQRYWGCPIPIVYDPEGNPHPVAEEHLPWLLPEDVVFGEEKDGSPLATSKELKERVERLYGEGWTPECDTLDVFVDSSWYFYRYLDPKDDHDFSDQALMKTWLPVDRYSGGSEHTTVHLLYSRFFHKALHDLALVPENEPFKERMNRGLIMGPDGSKMSKSKGNVVNPDEFVGRYGADAVRSYLAFIGPYNEPGNYPWALDGVESMRRFLDRVDRLREKVGEKGDDLTLPLTKAIQKVGADIERFKFNTALSTLMIVLKDFEAAKAVSRADYHTLLTLLSPLAPHVAEYLFEETGGEGILASASWPSVDESVLKEELRTVIVQISGKKRGEVHLSPDATEEEALKAAKELPFVVSALKQSSTSRIVYIPGRILNIVV